jgi:hypothetical protein
MNDPFEQLPSIDPVKGESFTTPSADDAILKSILNKPGNTVGGAPTTRRTADGPPPKRSRIVEISIIAVVIAIIGVTAAVLSGNGGSRNSPALQAAGTGASEPNPDLCLFRDAAISLTDDSGPRAVSVAWDGSAIRDCSPGNSDAEYGLTAERMYQPTYGFAEGDGLRPVKAMITQYPDGTALMLTGVAGKDVTNIQATTFDGTVVNAVTEVGDTEQYWLLAAWFDNPPQDFWKKVRYTNSDGTVGSTTEYADQQALLQAIDPATVKETDKGYWAKAQTEEERQQSGIWLGVWFPGVPSVRPDTPGPIEISPSTEPSFVEPPPATVPYSVHTETVDPDKELTQAPAPAVSPRMPAAEHESTPWVGCKYQPDGREICEPCTTNADGSIFC